MNNAARSLFLMPKGEAVCSVHIDTRQRQFWDVRQGLHDICHGNGKKRDVFFPRRSVLRNFAQKTKKGETGFVSPRLYKNRGHDMGIFKQLAIIIGCLAVGELIVWLTHVPVPSSILGMLLLTALLQMKVLKLEWVESLSDFLVANMGFFFVPPGVALMLYFDIIKAEFWPIVAAVVISTVMVMVMTGWSHHLTRLLIGKLKKREKKN